MMLEVGWRGLFWIYRFLRLGPDAKRVFPKFVWKVLKQGRWRKRCVLGELIFLKELRPFGRINVVFVNHGAP